MFGQEPITYGLLVQYKTFTTNILSSLLAAPGSPRMGASYNIAYKGKHRQKGIPFLDCRYIKGRDSTSFSIRKGREICHSSLCVVKGLKICKTVAARADDHYGFGRRFDSRKYDCARRQSGLPNAFYGSENME